MSSTALLRCALLAALGALALAGCTAAPRAQPQVMQGASPPAAVGSGSAPEGLAAERHQARVGAPAPLTRDLIGPGPVSPDAPVLRDDQGRELRDLIARQDVVLRDFRVLYEQRDRPRIALHLNCQLSDSIREWRPEVVAGTPGQPDHAMLPRQIETPARRGPPEDWSWRFEEGFSKPFLAAGVHLVDRTVIYRLAAAAAGPGSIVDPLGPKKVEMDALSQHADLLLEVLLNAGNDPMEPLRFRVTVLEVRTGRLLTSFTRPEDALGVTQSTREVVVATDRGPEIRTETTVRRPPLEELAGNLGLAAMEELLGVAW